ncbi:MAG: hypothetical protein D6718_04005 [Acidobacteria bacterium]|nr:MAG: hypothetical protein D6718_04005 [Acidobacteriota bacterium]
MTRFGWALDTLAAFVFVFAACAAVAWLVPVPEGPFSKHLGRRGVRMAARAAIVLGTLAAGIGCFGGSPPAVLAGALAGWLLPSAWEAKRIHDRIAGTDRRERG